MAGVRRADVSEVTLRPRARRPALSRPPLRRVAGWILVSAAVAATPSGAGAEGHDPAATTTSTTAAPGDGSTTTTTSPGGSTTSTTPATSTTSTVPPSSTTVAGDEGDDGPLPPASIELLPPEEELPPLVPPEVPPTPPAGAEEAGRRQAMVELRAAESALRKANGVAAALAKRLVPFTQRRDAARAAMAALDSEEQQAASQLNDARTKMKRIAVAGYVRGGEAQPVDYLLRAKDPLDLERRRTIITAATEARRDAVDEFAVAQRQTSEHLRAAVAALHDAEVAHDLMDAEVNSAAAIASLLAVEVEDKRLLLDHNAAASAVAGTDIPRLFFDAYRKAAATLAKRVPHCRVSWAAIAGIGKVESNHGRYRGAQFALNGDVYPRILGIPLDGTRSALIRDTDQGVLDSDLEFDRAVGPMQFIPSTWARINEDGNNDSVRDPNNAYDAALGTAAYLCRAVPSGGLDTDEALRPAFFSYNHSSAYVELVLQWSKTYTGDNTAAA